MASQVLIKNIIVEKALQAYKTKHSPEGKEIFLVKYALQRVREYTHHCKHVSLEAQKADSIIKSNMMDYLLPSSWYIGI